MPSNFLKLRIPLTLDARDTCSIELLAFIIHPQEPLSHLARLIQSELPTRNGVPDVSFCIEDTTEDMGITPAEHTKYEHEDTETELKHEHEHIRICDFIREAVHGGYFSIDIEGFLPIVVGLPDCNELTKALALAASPYGTELGGLARLKAEYGAPPWQLLAMEALEKMATSIWTAQDRYDAKQAAQRQNKD